MAYSEKSAARLAALHGEIEARKEHEFAAPTYRDAAALAEIRQTVFNQLESEHEHDRDTVEDSIAVLRYLAENYENMGRTACALPLRKKVLELDAELAALLTEIIQLLTDLGHILVRFSTSYFQLGINQ